MIDFKTYLFTNTTGDDQLNYFSGEFGSSINTVDRSGEIDIEKGTYRVVDGKFYRITTELPATLMECK